MHVTIHRQYSSLRSLCWCGYKSGGALAQLLSSYVALQGFEPKFFRGHSEGSQFGFVCADEVVVRL